jgi:hypothetical protein
VELNPKANAENWFYFPMQINNVHIQSRKHCQCETHERQSSDESARTSGIATFRRRLLRIHGTILALVALSSAVATTIGWMTGTGLFGFMQKNPMVWVGLIQAYLLMTIIAVLLVLGSDQANSRKWERSELSK